MKMDAIILAALPKERQAAIEALKTAKATFSEYNTEVRQYTISRIGSLSLAVPQHMGMGLTYAALATADALTDLSAKVVILTGIAGCLADAPPTGFLTQTTRTDSVTSSFQTKWWITP